MKILPNRTLFKIHGWLGLNVGLFLFVICFSGSFATISNEIDWLLNPALRIKVKDQPIAWEAMYQNLKKTYPAHRIETLFQQKNPFTEVGGYFTASAYVHDLEDGYQKVHLNPYTGEITGKNAFMDVQRFFRNYHMNLFFGDPITAYIITVFAFFLLFSALTGFLFYKSWLKNLFRLRLAKGLRVLIGDSHRLAGVWSLLFTLIIAITGIWYFIEKIAYDLSSPTSIEAAIDDKEPNNKLALLPYNLSFISLDEAVKKAEKSIPDYRVEVVILPKDADGNIITHGQDANPLTRDRSNQVHINPYTGEVVEIKLARDLPGFYYINNMADPLHFGTFGGLPVKILWFIFGMALSISILAGTYIWFLRHNKKLESKVSKFEDKSTIVDSPQGSGHKKSKHTRGFGKSILISNLKFLPHRSHSNVLSYCNLRFFLHKTLYSI